MEFDRNFRDFGIVFDAIKPRIKISFIQFALFEQSIISIILRSNLDMIQYNNCIWNAPGIDSPWFYLHVLSQNRLFYGDQLFSPVVRVNKDWSWYVYTWDELLGQHTMFDGVPLFQIYVTNNEGQERLLSSY